MRTGVAHLRALPPSVQLDLALKRANTDVVVSPIVHEVIHHACANSMVNLALQYRWLSLLRFLLSSPALGFGLDEEFIDLAAHLGGAEATLQPLAEGIAQFAEFDCVVPDSAAVRGEAFLGASDALYWRLLAMKHDGGHVDEFVALLEAERMDTVTIARKLDLLCTPTRPSTSNDTYLIGYLVVRGLWNKFVAENTDPRLRAPDFLTFILYYIYEDWELARLFVEPGPISIDAVERRLSSRLRALFATNVASRVAAFTQDMGQRCRERALLQRGQEELLHGPFDGLDCTRAELVAAMASVMAFERVAVFPGAALSDQRPRVTGVRNLQHALLMQVLDTPGPQVEALLQRRQLTSRPPVRVLDFVLDIPMRKRPYCFLMDLAVDVWNEAGELAISPSGQLDHVHRIEAPAANKLAAIREPARLVGVISSTATPWRFYAFIVKDHDVIITWGHGEPDAEEARMFAELVKWEATFELQTGLTFKMLNEYITRNALANDRVCASQDAAAGVIIASLRSLLEDAGWKGLLDVQPANDFGLRNLGLKTAELRSLAVASLAGAFYRDRDRVDALMRTAGTDLATATAVAARVQETTGVTLLKVEGDTVVAQV